MPYTYGMSRTIQRYGWRPSLPDIRDQIADTSGLKIAVEVDPRPHLTPVYDQGQLGSCTANAVAAAVDYDRIVHGEKPLYPSRLGIYFLERALEGQPSDQDTGAFGRDGFKAGSRYGYIPEKDLPYSDDVNSTSFRTDPRRLTTWKTDVWKLERPYKSVPRTINDIKAVLSNNQSVAFGFTVYESFESEAVATSGIMPVPSRYEQVLGGHEVLAVGYLKSYPHHVLVRNSWSDGWGIGGYFLMPWTVITNHQMASDLRTIYTPKQ